MSTRRGISTRHIRAALDQNGNGERIAEAAARAADHLHAFAGGATFSARRCRAAGVREAFAHYASVVAEARAIADALEHPRTAIRYARAGIRHEAPQILQLYALADLGGNAGAIAERYAAALDLHATAAAARDKEHAGAIRREAIRDRATRFSVYSSGVCALDFAADEARGAITPELAHALLQDALAPRASAHGASGRRALAALQAAELNTNTPRKRQNGGRPC